MFRPKGTQSEYRPYETRRDVRRLDTKINEAFKSPDGGTYLLATVGTIAGLSLFLPFGGEFALLTTWALNKAYMHPEKRVWNFPWRVPKHAKLIDGSKNIAILNELNKGNARKYKPSSLYGEGVTYYGICRESGLPVYATNSDDRTHLTCLGTTGSGKTEFLLGLVANQLVQNSGLIYVDAKGDPALQRDVSRLARRFGRDDDILTINFITSGRNLAKAQSDKITNTFNMMANTSDGMLIELLNNLLDDSSGGGGDMWKGRAMTFIAAVTRVLTYLRDEGFIQLSPQTYTQYMELSALEELVFEHDGKYGEFFSKVASSLVVYITTLPGYNSSPKARKKQEQKTVEQHGFIVMQLTRAINDLTYNYGHIFGVQQGDIDIFDCVLNRRILTIPLPALERAPDSLKMLGKLCIGSVKQMMAGSLGNRIEGLVREILDSRPTNSPNAFKLIFDEFGYIVISGTSVMPAQGRSLSFSICFAAQDYSDIKRGNENEAEAIWGNSNVKAIGRLVTGDNGDTMHKVNGVTGEEYQARAVSTDLEVGDFGSRYTPSANTQLQKEKILPYSDLAGQENGEFTLLISKKEDGGDSAGVKVIRIMSFYVAGEPLKYLRMNDLCPNFSIPKDRMTNPNGRIGTVAQILLDKHKRNEMGVGIFVSSNPFYSELRRIKNDVYYQEDPIGRLKAFLRYGLEEVSNDEQSFDTGAFNNLDEPNLYEHPDYIELDSEQSDATTSLNIVDIVKQKDTFVSRIEGVLDADLEAINIKSNLELDVKGTLSENTIEPINVFKLLNYAKDCEERLRQHNIQTIPINTNFGLLPFVPSHAGDLDTEHLELTERLKSIEETCLVKKHVSKSIADEANSIFESVCIESLKEVTNMEFENEICDTPTNRKQMLALIDLANQTKNRFKFY